MQVSYTWVGSNLPASAPSLAAKGENQLRAVGNPESSRRVRLSICLISRGDTNLELNRLSNNIMTGVRQDNVRRCEAGKDQPQCGSRGNRLNRPISRDNLYLKPFTIPFGVKV